MHARRVGSVLWLRTELAHTKSLERDVSARVVRGGNVQQAVLRAEAVERSDYRVRQAVGPRHLVVVGICVLFAIILTNASPRILLLLRP